MFFGRDPDWLRKVDAFNKALEPIASPKQYAAKKLYGALTAESENFDYDELVKAAGQAYSTEKVIKKSVPRLPGGPTGSGTGLFSTGSSRITVNPKVFGVGYAR